MRDLTQDRFLADVADHQLTILVDDGIQRHLRFRRTDTYCMGFDIVTWLGRLVYTGDMGTYVFTRVEDMFTFFRSDPRDDNKLCINPDYWSEKVIAQDRDGVTEFSLERFHTAIDSYLQDSDDVTQDIRDEVQNQLLDEHFHNEYEARDAVNRFDVGNFTFTDFYEYQTTKFTYRFIWCCYALVWGIGRYDAVKAQQGGPA